MRIEDVIKRTLSVAADIAQEEAHRLEGSALRSSQEGDVATESHFRHKANTARVVEQAIRTTKIEDFADLRKLLPFFWIKEEKSDGGDDRDLG